MTTEQVVSCAPFRLSGPRALTPFEWSVARNAVVEGFSRAGMGIAPDTQAAATALLTAVSYSNACPQWRATMFGPPPAVATLPYECLGEWFARLDYQTRLRALGDIQNTPLLCAPNPPWQACGADPHRVASSWEGAPQIGLWAPGAPVESCAEPRMRTAYTPMTLEELMAMFKKLGGQVPPVLEQGYSMLPPAARQRTVLLGIQLKPASPDLGAVLAGATNPMVLAQALIEEVAVVWAPGKGSSLTGVMMGNVNPMLLLELATAMMPDILAGGLQLPGGFQLPNIQIPGLPDLTTILSQLGGLFGTSKLMAYNKTATAGFGAGPTPTSGETGVPVIDTPGNELDPTVPIPGMAVVNTTFSPVKAAFAAGAAVAGVWLIWHFTKKAA